MRAANYYFQHLDKKVQVVVVSDATANQQTASPGSLSKAAASQQQATDTAVPLSGTETSDDELDKLLQSGGPGHFDIGALKPLQLCGPQQTPQTPQVWSLVLLSLLNIPAHVQQALCR